MRDRGLVVLAATFFLSGTMVLADGTYTPGKPVDEPLA